MPSTELWPLMAYFAAIVVALAAMLGVSSVLGQRTRGRATGEQFESGIVGVGDARLRLSANFYLVAMFFVIFDLETVYLFAWAVAFRQAGWAGYSGALVFIVTLALALFYLWRLGALDWAPPRRRVG